MPLSLRFVVPLVAAFSSISRFAKRHHGLVVENKGQSVALHYRLAPQLGASAAKWRLADPADARAWLRAWLAQCDAARR
jgi:trehalose-6-phosphatase